MTITQINFVPAFLTFYQVHKRFKFAHGGRGGAKSYSYGDILLLMGREHKLRILCTREIQKSIKDSVHTLLRDKIALYGFSDYIVQDTSIKNRLTGTEFIFTGLREHNITSLKSYEGIDVCWVEEAQDVSQKSLNILTPTIRKKGSEIWFSYNRMNLLDPAHKLFMRECGNDAVKKTFKPNFTEGEFIWYEYQGEDAIGIYINYDGNPYLTDELLKEMGKDKDDNPSLFRHKWLGEPQSQGDNTLISREKALAAVDRKVEKWDLVAFGIDPARYGDDESVICIREGFRILPLDRFNGINTIELSGRILAYAREYHAKGYIEPIRIKIDDSGIGGGVTDQLDAAIKEENEKCENKDYKRQFNIIVIPIINNAVSENPKYADAGMETWGNMKDALATISLPDDMILTEQMATRRYGYKPDGRLKLEKKDDMKKRQLKSPDRADALALCLTNYGGKTVMSEEYVIDNVDYINQ